MRHRHPVYIIQAEGQRDWIPQIGIFPAAGILADPGTIIAEDAGRTGRRLQLDRDAFRVARKTEQHIVAA